MPALLTATPLPEPHTALRYKTCATHCLVCNLPLCDAESVTVGVGPECRKRLGITRRLKQTAAANTLIASAAIAAENHQTCEALSRLRELIALDPAYQALVDRVRARLFKLRVVSDGEGFRVFAPYDAGFVQACYALRLTWRPIEKCREVPRALLDLVLDAMAAAWPHASALMPDDSILPLWERLDGGAR
jgi:Family of unknown function (DUF6011)